MWPARATYTVASIRTEPSWRSCQFSVSTVARVRHLLVRLQEDLLAHDLGGEQPVRQVGQVVVGIEMRPLRHGLRQRVQQPLQPVAGARR